jgi:hypothetical protein
MAQPKTDFGLEVQKLLESRSEQLFGIVQPLEASALGPFTGANSAQAVIAAQVCR